MIAHGKGVLVGGLLQAGHLRALASLYCVDFPLGVGVEHVGHQHALVLLQVPVGGIALAVEVGIGTEERHLLVLVPVGTLVVAVGNGRATHGVHVVAVGHAVDVEVRLPDVATGCGVTALVDGLAAKANLVVHSKVGVTTEETVIGKLGQQVEYLL